MLVSNQSDNIAQRLLTCARHVAALLSRAQLLRSSSRQAEQEFGIAKDKFSPTSPPHGLHGAGTPAWPHGHFIKPALTMSRATTCIGMAALLLLQADVHHADLLRHLGWTGGFTISSSTYSGDSGVTGQPASSPIRQWVCGSSPNFGSNLSSNRYNK